MADNDGTIKMALDVSPDEAIQSFKKLQGTAQKIFDSLDTDNLTKSEEKSLQAMDKLVTKGDELAKKVEEFSKPIETKEYTKLTREYDKLIEKIDEAKMKREQFLDTGGKEDSRTFNNMTSNIFLMEDKLEDVGREIDRIVAEGRQFEVPNDKLEDAKNSLVEINNQLAIQNKATSEISENQSKQANDLAQQVAKFLDIRLNAGEMNSEVAEITSKLREVTDELEGLRQRQQELEEAGRGLGYKEYDENLRKIRQLEDAQEGLTQKLVDYREEMTNLEPRLSIWERTAQFLKQLRQDILHPIQAFKRLRSEADNSTNAITRLKDALLKLGSRGLNIAKQGLSALVNRFKQAGTAASKFAGKLNFTKILGYAIGLRGLASVFNHLRSAMTQGITAMAKMNGGMNSTNAMMTKLLSTFNLLKGSLATAFAPIITIVGPILNSFMQQLANVITMIGMFIAKLTGAKSFVRATYKATDFATSGDKGGGGSKGKSAQQKYEEAVKKAQEKYDKAVARVTKSNEKKEAKAAERNAENMAKAEKKQAKAAEELAKKQEKANNKLAAFDDLNVLGKDDTDDYIDELEDLKEIQADLAEMPELELPNLEDYLGGGGGGGAGDPFGLEEVGLDGLEWDWSAIKLKAEKLGRELANILNDVFSNEGLAKDIGHAIAELLNTALHFAYGLIDTLDWRQMGRWFGTLIKEGIETFQWLLLGETIAKFLNGIADTIIEFFERYPAGLLGQKIADMFNRAIAFIDPAKLGEAVADVLKEPFIELSAFFTAANWRAAGMKLGEFFRNALENMSLNGMTLGQTIGQFLADAVNAGIDLLLGADISQALLSISAFFYDLFKQALSKVDWKDVFNVIMDVIVGLGMAIIQALGDLLIDIGTKVKGLIDPFYDAEAEAKRLHTEWRDLVDETMRSMQQSYHLGSDGVSEFTNAVSDLEAVMSEAQLEENFDGWGKALFDLQQQYGYTNDEMDDLIQHFYDTNAAAEEEAELVDIVEEGWASYSATLDEFGYVQNNVTDAMLQLIDTSAEWASGGAITWEDALKNIQLQYGFTNDEMDELIQNFVNMDSKAKESSELADILADGWGKYSGTVSETSDNIDSLTQKHNNLDGAIKGVGDTANKTGENVKEYVKISNDAMNTGAQNAKDYEDKTVTALQGISDKSDEVVVSFDTLTAQLNSELEGLTIIVDEWYHNIIETYFGYEVWYTVISEGMLAALNDALNGDAGWISTWDTSIEDWWTNHVKKWFSAEQWNAEIFEPWEKNRDTRWKALMKWWDDSMKEWWEKHVKTWFDVEALWNPMFKAVEEAAEKAAEDTKTNVNAFVQEIVDFVISACDTMIAKAQELIDKLQEALELARKVGGLGASGGGSSSSSSSSVSTSGGGGGGARSSGGRASSFMPMADIMHFEDGLGMSAFSFPELATGAVIPPNNKFLAVLGDQKSGYNIETPLATMMEAFRSVMDEYMNPGYNTTTMEVDGETFARLMLPHVMNEMHRQGYNTEIIEGI